MKKILLLSDTHGYIGDEILKHVYNCDEVWHAGDIGDLKVTDTLKNLKPLRAVYGNIDNQKARLEFPLNQKLLIEGLSVWITHIQKKLLRRLKLILPIYLFQVILTY